MKKILSLVLALLMIASLAACGNKGADKDLLAKIKEQGYIVLCTEPYFAPYEFIDPSKSGDEQYVGLDIELAKCIADKLDVELKIVPLDYTAVLAGIADGKYDFAVSAISYSPERAAAMNLSNVYLQDAGYGFIVRSEDADKYTSLESLKDAIVITQSASVQEGLMNAQVTECKETKLVANMTDAYLAVAEGKADVCICSVKSATLYAEANGGLTVPEFRLDVDPNMNGTVVALPKEGSDSLMAVINEVITELNADGTIIAWEEEYAAYAKSLGIE